MNLTSGTHTQTQRERESVIVSQCVFVFAEQRTTTGWQIVLLAANAFGSAIKSIYCPLKAPLPKSPCHPSVRPSVHSSVHPAVPSSCIPPLVGEAWGFCVCKIAKLLPQPHAARTIYLIHIQISDNARNSPPSLSPSPTLAGSWARVVAIVRCNIGNICLRFRFIFIELQKIGSPRLVANLEPRLRATHDALRHQVANCANSRNAVQISLLFFALSPYLSPSLSFHFCLPSAHLCAQEEADRKTERQTDR